MRKEIKQGKIESCTSVYFFFLVLGFGQVDARSLDDLFVKLLYNINAFGIPKSERSSTATGFVLYPGCKLS